MARQNINLGADPNDGEGDNLRTAFDKVNDNFIEVYTAGPVGSNIVISGNVISSNVTNANIELSPNGVGKVVVKNDLRPDQNNLRYLGDANLRFRGAYIGTAGINTTGDIITTGNISANNIQYTGEVFVGDLKGSVFADDSTVIVDAIDNVVSADSGVFGNIAAGNILPSANVTYNLGSPTRQWKELYVSGNTIYLDGQPIRVSGNTLSVNGSNLAIDGSVSYTVTSADVEAHQANLTITESQISDLQSYITGYTVTSDDVTAHQANLTITESQISDFGTYLTEVTSDAVTAHQANLSITESQISDLSHTSTGNFTFSNNGITTANAASNISIAINGATAGDPPAFVSKQWSFNTDGSFSFHNPLDIPSLQATITAAKVGQWDDAYGWGDHSTQGYLTSYTVTSNDVTQHQGNLSITESQISDLGNYIESDTTGITGADAVSNIVTLTQSEYNAIGSPNASTVYIIVG